MKVVIVEDQGLYLDLLTDALGSRGITIVGRATTEPEALRVVDDTAPDLAVIDIRLSKDREDEGLQVAERVRAKYPDVALLVLSAYLEPAYAERLLTMERPPHAVGYLGKDRLGDLDELLRAFRTVMSNGVVIDPDIVSQLMSRRRSEDPVDRLTPHERRVLSLVAEGRSNLGIAQELNVKISTVERQLSTIFDKLGLATDVDRRNVNLRVLAALAFLRGTPDS